MTSWFESGWANLKCRSATTHNRPVLSFGSGQQSFVYPFPEPAQDSSTR
jgi:hypothetical protein